MGFKQFYNLHGLPLVGGIFILGGLTSLISALFPDYVLIPVFLLPAWSVSIVGAFLYNEALIMPMIYLISALYLVTGYGLIKKQWWALWLLGLLLILLLWAILALVFE